MYSRILVPIDGRPASEHAAFSAFDLANRFGSEVVLVHVTPESRTRPGRSSGASDRLEACARALLDRWERIGRATGATVTARLASGRDPATTIAAIAATSRADLILVGTRGRACAAYGTLLGSTAERLTRASTIPVMLVRRPGAARPAINAMPRGAAQELHRLPALAASPSDWSASD